jgi:hypothetical protein
MIRPVKVRRCQFNKKAVTFKKFPTPCQANFGGATIDGKE